MSAVTKAVKIVINVDDLNALKDGGYRLCFAKKVNETFNVVWEAYDRFLQNNTFSWEPRYELFGSNEFEDAVTVDVSTDPVSISLGEQANLDENGVLSSVVTGGPSSSITMINNYGPIHPGVSQISKGVDGSEVSTPIYVAEEAIVPGSVELTPVDIVQVWFEQDIETSTMFSDARSKAVEIDLTRVDFQARLYKDGKWSIPAPEELARYNEFPEHVLLATPRAIRQPA